jgi:hypothetical protein
MKIHIEKEAFLVSKTSDKFYEVRFVYEKNKVWSGCVPNTYKELSLELSYEEICTNLEKWYAELRYENRPELVKKAKIKWGIPAPEQTETGKVFLKLLEGNCEWVCRTCGTGKINDQPAARIRDIKKRGYIIATKTRSCSTCNIRTYQDILILITVNAKKRQEYRQPIDEATKAKIISVLGYKDAVFDVRKTGIIVLANGNIKENLAPECARTGDAPQSGTPSNTPSTCYGRVENTIIDETNKKRSHVCDFISEMQKNIPDTDLLNIRDELVGEINKNLYLFTLK